ncbi:MAG: sulfatase-like hydrolase/transferase [Eubacterium sp.]|nr:sulfatase-like hydrolase/transferase [Eubacterium sp.]
MEELANTTEKKEKRLKITWKMVRKVANYFVPLITPFLCFIITEFTWRVDSKGVLNSNPFVTISTKLIILNLLLFYAFWGICFSIIGRSSVASYITIAFSFIIGLANYYIMIFRGNPITASDFKALRTAFAVSGTYSYMPTSKVIIIFVCALAVAVVNIFFKFKLKKMQKIYSKILIRVIPAILCICVMFGVTSFISRQDIRKIIPDFNATLFTGNVMAKEDGLILCFASTIQYTNVDKPDGYSPEKAKKILDDNKDDSVWKTSSISKTSPDKNTFNTKAKKANIVVIMNECFSDIGILGDLKTNIDYMPFTKKMMKGYKDTISGYYYSSVIAGSTANTEFEYLTGDTMAFLPPGSIPYQQFIDQDTESMASDLRSQGYATIGTHPYVGYGWNRRKTYPRLGFGYMRFAIDMTGLKKLRIYTDDESYYKYLKNHIFYRRQPFFSFNVTMQNHGGYAGTFDNFNPNVHMTNANNQPTDNYLSLIKKSDEQFEKLIAYFKTRKEPTIVVMFGDHQPNDYVVEPIYTNKGRLVTELKGADRFERYKVPVIMWANYDIPEDNKLITSANYMGGMVTKLAGCKTSAYQNFLEKLRAKVPVICSQGYMGTDGKYRDLETIDDYAKEIGDYRILDYYNLFK